MSQLVECPLCKQSFKVALPSKVAKGVCPRCKCELILLPDGTLKSYTTKRKIAEAPTEIEQKVIPQIAQRQVVNPPANKQHQHILHPKQVQVKVNGDKELGRLPTTRPLVSKKVIPPPNPPLPNVRVNKPLPSPLTKVSLPPTKRFTEINTNNVIEEKLEESNKDASLIGEKHFVKLGTILLLVQFVIGGGLYAVRKIPAVETCLTRSGEIAVDGFVKLFAVPPPDPVKTEKASKPNPDEVVKQSDLSWQKEDDNKEYEKRRLGGIIAEKLGKLRLTERTKKKYAEGALTDEQKLQVENIERNIETDKAEIEDMKKEYQDKFGVPFEEGNDN